MRSSRNAFLERLQRSQNILLMRDDVGKAKAASRALPDVGHSYGFKPKSDPEGASAILSSWKVHRPSQSLVNEVDY